MNEHVMKGLGLKVGDKLYGYNMYNEIFNVTVVEGSSITIIGDNKAKVGINATGFGRDSIELANTYEEAVREAAALNDDYINERI